MQRRLIVLVATMATVIAIAIPAIGLGIGDTKATQLVANPYRSR